MNIASRTMNAEVSRIAKIAAAKVPRMNYHDRQDAEQEAALALLSKGPLASDHDEHCARAVGYATVVARRFAWRSRGHAARTRTPPSTVFSTDDSTEPPIAAATRLESAQQMCDLATSEPARFVAFTVARELSIAQAGRIWGDLSARQSTRLFARGVSELASTLRNHRFP